MAGVDEVGRGCLAGPVVAAAVILPVGCNIPGVNDSKKLTAKKREELLLHIEAVAISTAVGVVSSIEIDRINILQASLRAMVLALEALNSPIQHVLIDGREKLKIAYPQTSIIKGDSRSLTVAAASIVAKVTRDRMMVQLDDMHPGYSFAVHKGYGTKIHLEALRELGATSQHRKSFAPVRELQTE